MVSEVAYADLADRLAEKGLRLEIVPLDKFKFYEKNNKKHGQKDLAAIHASIKEFGMADVVICDNDYEIIAGHGRVMAAKEVGETDALALIPERLNKSQAAAYRIAHNQTSRLSKFNDSNVISELHDLKFQGFDMEWTKPLKMDKWMGKLDVPDFDLAILEPPKKEEITSTFVPDAIWPSDNDWGIPVLSLNLQADALDLPAMQWGDLSRKQKMKGTWHFYCEDDKFESIWKDPTKPLASQCINCVEPNFSCYDQMARAYVMGLIYKKRWISRYWQSLGVRVFVDLNVNERFYDLNMLGVPQGWKAYATRGYSERLDNTLAEFDLAVSYAGTKEILFWVYGGGQKVKKLCQDNGFLWIEDRRKFDRTAWSKEMESQLSSIQITKEVKSHG